ncbi:hypothetical protein HK100_006210, partial [Physocladia obscura]
HLASKAASAPSNNSPTAQEAFDYDSVSPTSATLKRNEIDSNGAEKGSNWEELDSPLSDEEIAAEPHVVLSAEESLQERYPVSYLNPTFSKPLERPWLPLAVAGWWQLLPRYISEPDLEAELENAKIETKSAPNILHHNSETVNIFRSQIPGDGDEGSKNIESRHTQAGVITSNSEGLSLSLDSIAHSYKLDKFRHLKGMRRGSMSKGLVVVGIKDHTTKDCTTKSVEQLQSVVIVGDPEGIGKDHKI